MPAPKALDSGDTERVYRVFVRPVRDGERPYGIHTAPDSRLVTIRRQDSWMKYQDVRHHGEDEPKPQTPQEWEEAWTACIDHPQEGWNSFGGWPTDQWDAEQVDGVTRVIADEHRLFCEQRDLTGLPYRIEWFIDGERVDGTPQVQPRPDWAVRPTLGEGCMVELGQRGVEGRPGSWPFYCGEPTEGGWATCPIHRGARHR